MGGCTSYPGATVSLRLFLPLLVLCTGSGYVGGRLAHASWAQRPAAAADPATAAAARQELARVRAAGSRREALRRAFLQRFPDSWLRASWERGR